MLKKTVHMIKIPLQVPKDFSLSSTLKTKMYYNFSSQNHQPLNQSEFSKELGLQRQYKKLVKIQKSNENSSFRFSATGFVIISMIIGGYIFIRVIDSNQRKLLQYKFKKWANSFNLSSEQRQKMKKKISIDHENNLKQIYEKSYKNRSNIDAKFLRQLQNDIYQNKKISTQILQLLDQIRDKFETAHEERIAKAKDQFLSILEKVVYHQLKTNGQNRKIIPQGSQNIVKNFSKFLLKKGNLNHQLLGLKYLQEKSSHERLIKIIFKQQAEMILQRLEINNKILQDSLRVDRKKNEQNQSKSENQTAKKLVSIKKSIFYSMLQLKTANEIRKSKIDFLRDLLTTIATQ